MRKLLILICLFISAQLSAQVYQIMPQYGYQTARMRMDSVLLVPADTIRNKSGVVRIGTQLYAGNGSFWTLAGGADSSVLFTNYRADTMRSNLYANKVPYTGATQDVDLGAFKLNAQSVHIKGTAGAGHLGLKHQSAAATASGNETSLYANSNGDIAWKNDNLYITTLKTSGNTADRVYTYPDSTGTVALLSNVNVKQDTATAWKTGGNFNVNAGQFIGSHNNASLRFRTNNTERMVVDTLGGIKLSSLANNSTLNNALQLANSNNRSFFNISTNNTITNLTLKANNDAVGDSLIISDSGLIQPRSNATLWLKSVQSGNNNVVANRCAGCGSGSIFSANQGTSAPIFNVLSTGQVSIGSETPASTSALDITSTTRGMLIPRMTTTQRNAISTPATGLMVWNTTDTTLNQYTGNTWRGLVGYNPSGTINYTAPTITSTTVTPILDLSQTWNNASLANTGIRLNVTNTASDITSNLIDLRVGATSQFRVRRDGVLITNGGATFSGSITGVSNITTSQTISGGNPISYSGVTNLNYSTTSNTSNILTGVNIGDIFQVATTGTGGSTYRAINIGSTINQTLNEVGISRGLYVNPTLTAAADWRAIETTAGQLRMADAYGAGSGSLARSLLDLSQTWNTTGNPAAIRLNVTNTASGSTASLMDLQVGGTSYFTVDKGAKITQFATNTAAGTTGNQTINRPTGTVNIAAAGTTVTVTNNLVTANSLVFAVIRTNDATATIKNVVPGAGTFTINLNAAATAETSIGFWVIN